jgi:hypothetical protein
MVNDAFRKYFKVEKVNQLTFIKRVTISPHTWIPQEKKKPNS